MWALDPRDRRGGRSGTAPVALTLPRRVANNDAHAARWFASAQAVRQGAPTVVSNPPRDFGPGAPPTTYFSDPDVLTIDPAFGALVQPNAAIVRLWTGALWAEGPAW